METTLARLDRGRRVSDEIVERRGFAVADDGELARAERRADLDEREFDRGAGVTVARDVRQVHAAPMWAGDFGEKFARGLVGKMAVTAADPLLERPWATRVGFQQFGTVIRLDDHDVAAAEVLAHVLRRVAEVGEQRERVAREKRSSVESRGETEANRLLRIVWHGEALNLEIAEAEARAGFERLPVGPVRQPALHRARGGGVGEHADVRKFFQAIDAAAMIAVLVGEENGIDPVEGFAHGREQRGKLAGGKSGVDEHACAFGDE